MVDHIAGLLQFETAVDRNTDCADFGAGDQCHDEVEAVRHEDADPVSSVDAETDQARCKSVCALGEFGIGKPLAVNDGGGSGVAICLPVNDITQRAHTCPHT